MPSIPALIRHIRADAHSQATQVLKKAGFRLRPVAELSGFVHRDFAEVQDIIAARIEDKLPTLVARFGKSELDVSIKMASPESFSHRNRVLRRVFGLVTSSRAHPSFSHLGTSGFYPTNERASLEKFSSLYFSHIEEIDVLGSWIPSEQLIADQLRVTAVCRLHELDPFLARRPWTGALEGMKVLVVSPFKDSIEAQFRRRKDLFKNDSVLPHFALECIRPPVTFNSGSGSDDFERTWFEGLRIVLDQVSSKEFDVLIAGAGSYGLSIAAQAKKLGRVGINLGAVTQLLFGIWGERWNSYPSYEQLRGPAWIRPSREETPPDALSVENGAYW